jgi:uncharacterized protein involved in response to NO
VPGQGERRFASFLVASLTLALTVGMTLGAINLARLTGTWGFVSRPSVWAHGYVQVFGFFALFVMGFAYHAVPRFVAAPLQHPRFVPWSLVLQVVGVLGITAAFLLPVRLAGLLWPAGAIGLLAAASLFAAALRATLHARRHPKAPFERWMMAGASWLVVGSLLALAAAIEDDVAWHHLLWPATLYGFTGSWILGAGRRLFPISLGWKPRWPSLERPAFVAYQLGVVAWSLGAWPASGSALSWARGLGAAALLLATPLYAGVMGLAGPRQRWAEGGVERDYERYVHAAWTWLFVALAAGPGWTLAALVHGDSGSLTMLDFSRHTLALGFATQMIVAIGSRFVPAFTGTRLWSPRGHRLAFWLLNLAVGIRGLEAGIAMGHWAEAWPLLALSGPPALAAIAVFSLNLFIALRAPVEPLRLSKPRHAQ